MKTKKSDLRVQKTERLLRQSLKTLMEQKPYTAITVKELSDLAQINRGTFYLHYDNIPDMVHKLEKEFLDGMDEEVYNKRSIDDLKRDPFLRYKDILEYSSENSTLFLMLTGDNGSSSFKRRFKDLMYDRLYSTWLELYNNKDEDEMHFFLEYALAGSLEMLRSYLEDSRGWSVEKFARFNFEIVTHGRSIVK